MALQLFFPMNPLELKSKPEKLELLMDDLDWGLQLKKEADRII